MKDFDYIFAGSGLAALMTVYRMMQSGKLADKTMLLLDENPKKSNDRTWCFWEKPYGDWDHIVSKKWKAAIFANQDFSRKLDLNPYEYKMIRGIDFYQFIFAEIATNPNIQFLHQKVKAITDQDSFVLVETEENQFRAKKVFSSIYDPQIVHRQSKYPILQQHFIGWFIKAESEIFNPQQATFMDFSVEQKGNTRFMYVLPTSKTEALIEYTLFSKDLLPTTEYEDAIKKYIENLGISNYTITEKERGSIPMTSFPFWNKNSKNIIYIGSSGGWTKASSGYTFKRSDKKSKELVSFLEEKEDFRIFYRKDKFWFYDLLLLDILAKQNELGSEIFSSLFKEGNPGVVFKFLDEESTFFEDLQVIWKCPKSYFVKALFNRVFRF